MSGQVTPYHHLYFKGGTFITDRYIGCRCIQQPVRTDIPCCIQHIGRDLVQHLAFAGNGAGQDDIKSGNPVAGHHDQPPARDCINIPDLTPVKSGLVRKGESSHFPKVGRGGYPANLRHTQISTFYPVQATFFGTGNLVHNWSFPLKIKFL